MAHADHDAIVEAFLRVDPRITICHRGGVKGYTHMHGPSQVRRRNRCSSHWIVVEKANGTVALRDVAGVATGCRPRPLVSINADPLGYSFRKNFGHFARALTASDIQSRWPTFHDFADDAIRHVRGATTW